MTTYGTAEVARRAGIHRDTLLRWLRQGLLPPPPRDPRGWRRFTQADLEAIERLGQREGRSHRSASAMTDASSALRRVDWGFRSANTSYLTHALHPYPAKFIPPIPNVLIQELSAVGDTVADVFCGSGTTLVEGLLLKRHVVGVDANPLACLIADAKTTRVEQGDLAYLRSLAERALKLADRIAAPAQSMLFGTSTFESAAERPQGDALGFWFDPFVVEELAEVLSWCRQAPSDAARALALTSFSSIVVNVSKQDSDTRYVRRHKGTSPGEPLRRFARSIQEAANASEQLSEIVDRQYTCRILNESVLDQPELGRIDLVVSSPPYPNAYSYHLYHMTRMLWLGMDHQSFKTQEIGSHRKYSSKSAFAATPDTFLAEMTRVMQWVARSLTGRGYACFVIGDSTIGGQRIDNGKILAQAGAAAGLVEIDRIERPLNDARKSFNPAIGKIKTEYVLVLRKAATDQ